MGMMLAFTALFLLTWLSVGQAQSLLEVIGQNNLTELSATFSSYPDLLSRFSNVTNVTFLAPSNDAFKSFRSSSAGQAATRDPGLMPAMLVRADRCLVRGQRILNTDPVVCSAEIPPAPECIEHYQYLANSSFHAQ